MKLCDLHNHLLSDVDDGCRSMAETVYYLRDFRTRGVTEIVLTPHLHAATLDRVGVSAALDLHRYRYRQLMERVDGRRGFPDVLLGQEILAREADDLRHVVGRQDVGLAGGACLLVEFGFGPGFDADGVIRRVQAEGRRIVVAHPERYDFAGLDGIDVVSRWLEMGALVQVNGGSLAGLYTSEARELGIRLIRLGLADMVCSDHHGDARPHSVSMVMDAIRADAGPGGVEELMGRGPRRVLPANDPALPDGSTVRSSFAGNAA